MSDRWPHGRASRQYAAEIIRLPEAERAQAMERVPDVHKVVVALYVRDWPPRFRESIRASALLICRMPRRERVLKLRSMPVWRRARVKAEAEAARGGDLF